jgi:hypothetical protein
MLREVPYERRMVKEKAYQILIVKISEIGNLQIPFPGNKVKDVLH